MIKNIVLDMGNVCCKWDVSYIASQLASSLEEKDYIIKHLFQTKQWAQLDQGVLSLQDAKKQLIEQIPDEKRDLIVYAFEHWFILISLMKWKNLLKDIRVKDINFICCLIAQCNFINIINQNLFFNILKSFIHLQNIKK